MVRTLNAALLLSCLLPTPAWGESIRLVADSDRGLHACWENPSFAGRDFWIMIAECLHREEWRGKQYGLSSEDFVREAGVSDIRATSLAAGEQTAIMKDNSMLKTIAVRLIELFGDDPGKDLAPRAMMRVAAGEKARVYETKALNDGTTNTAMVVRGDEGDLQRRFQPLAATIDIELPEESALREIRIHHGVRRAARIQTPRVLTWRDGKWRETSCRVETDEPANRIALFPQEPVKTGRCRLELQSRPYRITFHPERLPLSARLKEHPFTLGFIRVNEGDFLGLRKENIDAESFGSFLREYRDTFVGFEMSEWDSNVKGLDRDKMRAYLPTCTNRESALRAWKQFFDYQKTTLFDTVYALSGNVGFSQYAAAWGAKVVSMETAGNLASLPFRSMLLVTRGGARQFGVPWEYYIAYYAGAANPEKDHPGWGKAVSQARRELFSGYYMGATFLRGEGQNLSLVKLDKATGRYGLSDHGRTFKEIHAWARSEKGARGQSYTPILFLVDYHHGRMGRRWGGNAYAWKIWNELPMSDGDYMTDQVLRATDPPIPDSTDTFTAPYSVNTLNSRLGDVFDLFFANPPQHGGVVRKCHLDRYPVVMLLGDVAMTPALVERLRTYVHEGGTLVLNVAQAKAGLDDPEFLGVETGDERLRKQRVRLGSGDFPMVFRTVRLKGAEAVMLSQPGGVPLLTRHRFGKGHVLLSTPEYLLLEERQTANPFIEELLLALQREVLPFQLEGPPCQFLMNRISPSRWRVILINNAGVIKHPFAETEYHIEQYAAAMSIVAPAGASAEEILAGANVVTTPRHGESEQAVFAVNVPPGDIRVLDIRLAGKTAARCGLSPEPNPPQCP